MTIADEANNRSERASIFVMSGSETPSALEVVYPVTYFQNATDPSRAVPIVLRPGDSETADFNLHAIPAVRMRVRTHHSSPVDGQENIPQIEYAQRSLGSYNARIATEATLVEPGILEVSGLPPGSLAMRVGAGESGPFTSVDAGRTAEFDASEITAAIAIRGTLQFEDGSAVREQTAVAFRDRATSEIRMADYLKDGTFELRSPGGATVAYDVSLANSDFAVKSVAALGGKSVGQTIEVTGTQDVRLAVKIAKSTAIINGVVLRSAKPVPGAMILLVPTDPAHNASLLRQQQSDSDGTFSLTGVMAGKYTLLAIEDGWDLDWHDAGVLVPYLAGGEPLEVAAEHIYEAKLKAIAAKVGVTSATETQP
jgi:hypothetical protein